MGGDRESERGKMLQRDRKPEERGVGNQIAGDYVDYNEGVR